MAGRSVGAEQHQVSVGASQAPLPVEGDASPDLPPASQDGSPYAASTTQMVTMREGLHTQLSSTNRVRQTAMRATPLRESTPQSDAGQSIKRRISEHAAAGLDMTKQKYTKPQGVKTARPAPGPRQSVLSNATKGMKKPKR